MRNLCYHATAPAFLTCLMNALLLRALSIRVQSSCYESSPRRLSSLVQGRRRQIKVPQRCRGNMTAEIWDVIVVGAGLSGLSAAHFLRRRNPRLKVLILDGKGELFGIEPGERAWRSVKTCPAPADRVGGRTVSRELPAAGGTDWWDFGGQWIGRWSSRSFRSLFG